MAILCPPFQPMPNASTGRNINTPRDLAHLNTSRRRSQFPFGGTNDLGPKNREMTTLADLSLELIDRILFALDPLDVACISQTSRFFHEIIYGPSQSTILAGTLPHTTTRRSPTHSNPPWQSPR
ncbi:hypothetical protein J3R83DRAFT_5622 [Lanmaoa asiatica]|nr:hypothetical protein J3R83DRAFT_5622 [Lanmaoa asiatica]